MSWKSVKGIDSAGTEEYVDFVKRFLTDEVMDSVLDGKYTGEDKSLIEEKISADLSQIGLVFDPENIPLNAQRFRSMKIRNYLDKKLRPVCESTDETWSDLADKLDLTPEQKEEAVVINDMLAKAKTGSSKKDSEDSDDEDEEMNKAALLRPFCLYSIDAEHLYEQKLDSLPTDPVVFAKLAFEHEMDCAYEDDEDDEFDEEWKDLKDEEDDDISEDEQIEEGDEEVAKLGSKIAESEKDPKTIKEEEFAEDDQEGDDDYEDTDDIEMEFPFDESEIKIKDAKEGFELLGKSKDQIISMLQELTGVSVDSFKYYSLPGRHYIVCWVETLGIFGVRLCEPYTAVDEDSDDEFDDDELDE
ncbi:hypothetical protein AYI69_g3260 [Smittium culicis]|uniref:Uncharacterized protein n=1 Tax=Smittium culicis TaxID=133412 RepID=A0A1R1YK57_9FUNG|nr:hypothetical protein AYI69_g3260 [Smittium culicis]